MGVSELSTVMQGSSAFDALLMQCRDLACAQLDTAIAAMLAKTDDALSELATKTQNRETQKLYLAAKDAARTKRAEFEKLFHSRFLAEFQQRTNKAKKTGGSFSDADLSSLELSLVADDDLEETLKFNELAARLRRICEDEINALDQRVGVLLGDADLQSEANPLSPNAICDAYKHCCRNLIEGVELRSVFLLLFDDHVLDAVRSIYKAVNDLLVQNSILPKIRYGAPKKDRSKKKFKEVDAGDDEESPAEDMFAALQKLMAAAGGGGGGGGPGNGVGGTPLMQGAELLGSLTQLQLDGLAALGAGATLPTGPGGPGTANILHELKSSSVGTSMGQMDAMTLDVVARLFDQLFDDPKIPLGAKGLIGRLQIPMLKVAIADKEFFSKKDNPARLLLDTLGEIAIRLPADFNTDSALYGHLEAILQELITGYKDDAGIFGVVREGLIALMQREDERIEAEARAAAEKIVQEEALGIAKAAAQAAVSARLQVPGQALPGPVLEFIIEQWLQLMMLIHVKRGPVSEPWNRSIEVVDQLIWSVQPNKSTEDRRKLAGVVPVLLKSLTAGLQAAGIDDAVREAFFPELMRLHTAILSAPVKSAAAPVPEAPKAPAAALDFTPKITIKNPFGEGRVQVAGLEPDAEETAMNLSRHATDPDALRVGDWFEWKEKGGDGEESHRPVRLIFMTPRKTRYIFRDRSEKDYIECTRNEVVRRLRTGEALLMEEEPEVPFFERIMGGVISKMKGAVAAA
ncbi:MAG TPA: DUF1631 family protein [Burkholderiales bacterium]|nr:DUF1631 family protein [Burkholderiales bacterium]